MYMLKNPKKVEEVGKEYKTKGKNWHELTFQMFLYAPL